MIRGCQSKNVAFLAFPLLGENWHNNHHAAPASASTWAYWYQFDCVYLTLRVFQCLGLVETINVQVPSIANAELPEPVVPRAFVGWPALLWTTWAVLIAAALEVRRWLRERQAKREALADGAQRRHAALASLLQDEA